MTSRFRTVAEVPLDDVEAAVEFYLAREAEGGPTADEMQVLLQAQRDPDALLDRLDELGA